MKKNPKPLTILVTDQALYDTPEVQALCQKGHFVYDRYCADATTDVDVLVGPTCWRINPALGKLAMQLKLMETAVRNIKYPKKEAQDALP